MILTVILDYFFGRRCLAHQWGLWSELHNYMDKPLTEHNLHAYQSRYCQRCNARQRRIVETYRPSGLM